MDILAGPICHCLEGERSPRVQTAISPPRPQFPLPCRLRKDISQLMAMARRTVRVSRSLFADQVPVEGGRGSRRLVPRTVHCVLVPCDVGGGPRGGLFGWTAGRLAARLLSNLPGLWNVVWGWHLGAAKFAKNERNASTDGVVMGEGNWNSFPDPNLSS